MRKCICGKAIARRKQRGGREREYCCDAHRQQAYRERHKGQLSLRRALHESHIRMIDSLDQDYHRETWQDELRDKDHKIDQLTWQLEPLERDLNICHLDIELLRKDKDLLQRLLEHAEVEIIRLNTLLDSQSKKHPPR